MQSNSIIPLEGLEFKIDPGTLNTNNCIQGKWYDSDALAEIDLRPGQRVTYWYKRSVNDVPRPCSENNKYTVIGIARGADYTYFKKNPCVLIVLRDIPYGKPPMVGIISGSNPNGPTFVQQIREEKDVQITPEQSLKNE